MKHSYFPGRLAQYLLCVALTAIYPLSSNAHFDPRTVCDIKMRRVETLWEMDRLALALTLEPLIPRDLQDRKRLLEEAGLDPNFSSGIPDGLDHPLAFAIYFLHRAHPSNRTGPDQLPLLLDAVARRGAADYSHRDSRLTRNIRHLGNALRTGLAPNAAANLINMKTTFIVFIAPLLPVGLRERRAFVRMAIPEEAGILTESDFAEAPLGLFDRIVQNHSPERARASLLRIVNFATEQYFAGGRQSPVRISIDSTQDSPSDTSRQELEDRIAANYSAGRAQQFGDILEVQRLLRSGMANLGWELTHQALPWALDPVSLIHLDHLDLRGFPTIADLAQLLTSELSLEPYRSGAEAPLVHFFRKFSELIENGFSPEVVEAVARQRRASGEAIQSMLPSLAPALQQRFGRGLIGSAMRAIRRPSLNRQELVDLITPAFRIPREERRALLLLGAPGLGPHFNIHGSPRDFAERLVDQLLNERGLSEGESALWNILQALVALSAPRHP